MAKRFGVRHTASMMAVLALVGACGQNTNTEYSSAKATECVQIDEGNYLFQDGKFVKVNAPAGEATQRSIVAAAEPADSLWYDKVEASFAGMGFAWLGLNVRKSTATLTGLAPDAAAKTAAYEAGKEAILADTEGANMIVVDGISIEGGEAGVGVALAALDDTPSLEACQQAFLDTMQGRNVQFRIGSASILPASAKLLDAVSGVASICTAYNIEIGGHTDSIGDNELNQRLSQQRANSVRTYLESKNVSVTNVTAIGYGETRPIDDSGTRAGDALNRRTEFKVSAR